jgi:hypothetical protein
MMKKHLIISIGFCILASMALPKPADEDGVKLNTNENGNASLFLTRNNKVAIEVLGVMSFDKDDLVCWDVQGKKSPLLKDTLMAKIVMPNQEIGLRLHKKNRFMIVKKAATPYWYEFKKDDKGLQSYLLPSQDQENWSLVALWTEPTEKTATVGIELLHEEIVYAVMDAKAGASLKLGNTTYTLEKMSSRPFPKKNEKNLLILPGKTWIWNLEIKEHGDKAEQYPGVLALNDKKEQIQYADRKGNLVDEVTYLTDPEPYSISTYPKANDNRAGKHKYVRVYMPQNTPSEDLQSRTISINVNPSFIKFIELYYHKIDRFEFKDIPLDPVQP